MTATIVYLSPEEIDGVWGRVAPHIAPALAFADGRFTLDGVLGRIKNSKCVLLVAAKDDEIIGTLGVEVLQYDAFKVAWVAFVGGKDIDLWADAMWGIVERYARESGCKVVEGSGRCGWSRFCKKFGHTRSDAVTSKEL